ncbi:MAG: SAM-dependent methyltransferase [Oscillospiraceae bacterium]|nr:SAM-dependent methyltransferase [Oscillospiraceae bacterium]
MASLIDSPHIKEKCQIFTPADIVAQMLDLAGYGEKLFGKTVLENSCGNGEFLVQIVERYIESAIREGVSRKDIQKGLEHDIVAYEIDEELIGICKVRLDAVALKYDMLDVDWNICCDNFLAEKVAGQYNYIIGNPPYIAYPDLPENERREIRALFSTCKKGKFDYSYAFIEKSFEMLTVGGKLVYIIPSNIFKNVFAEELRKLIKNDLKTVIDFPQDQIFSGVLVSPAIILVEKGSSGDRLIYSKTMGKETKTELISKERFEGKWIFETVDTLGTRLGEYFKVSNSIATLCNPVFVLKDGYFDAGYYCIENDRIETAILRKTTGPKSKRYRKGKEEYIIFPYYYDNDGNLLHYTEEEMQRLFPCAMQYLEKHRSKLDKRKSDESAEWFEYGRSQALRDANRRMIMVSSVISEDTKAYLLDKGELPYAGLYIIPTGTISLEDILKELNSSAFKKYISRVGVSVSGSSKRITTKDIENYVFTSAF